MWDSIWLERAKIIVSGGGGLEKAKIIVWRSVWHPEEVVGAKITWVFIWYEKDKKQDYLVVGAGIPGNRNEVEGRKRILAVYPL